MFSISSRWLLSLLAVSLLTLPACQRAKMQPIPRQERPNPGPGASEPIPEVSDQDKDPNLQTPVMLPPVEPEGEGDTEPSLPPRDNEPDPNIGPIEIVTPPAPLRREPVAPQRPVTQQPNLPNNDRNVIPWLDPNAPAHPSVLNRCAWENCEEPPAPPQPIEKEAKSYTQTSEAITNKLDILFVMDTSNSLDEERTAIATNMRRFIQEVEKISQRTTNGDPLDYEMAVLLGHGPNTSLTGKSGSAYGNLFVHQGESLITNPVLKSSEMDVELMSQTLLKRFNGNGDLKSTRDRSNTQGEAGLLSLGQFLRDQINNSTGFPRKDAALMIIFVSDENDVCYDYKAANDYFASIGLKRRDEPQVHSSKREELDGISRDKPEHEAFVRECGSGDRGQPETIVNLIKNIKDHSSETNNNLPIIPTALVYRTKGEQKDAQKRKGPFSGDNEMGHGYLNVLKDFGSAETVSLLNSSNDSTNGAVGLLERDYGIKLANLGKEALFSMNFLDTLELKTPSGEWLDLRIIPNSSIRVDVEVKAGRLAGQTITLNQDTEYTIQRIQLEPGAPIHGKILLQRESRSGLVWDNAVIRIYYAE